MIRHWAFLKQGDTSFGTFHPKHCIVAGYPSLHHAQEAGHAFTESGAGAENVRAASGDFVVNQLEAHREANRPQRAEAQIAEFAGRESGFLRDDAELARNGGAFLSPFAPEAGRDRADHRSANGPDRPTSTPHGFAIFCTLTMPKRGARHAMDDKRFTRHDDLAARSVAGRLR